MNKRLGKVWGFAILPITQERIEFRTIHDIRYAQYRLERLQIEYPERFGQVTKDGECKE
ncbi:MAG: hypothetical protein ACR2LL_08705 [Nitrosopumilus sp.]